ncbi:MAG: hypothetical protein IID37_12005 [Planctomycetes bacterium]|nr:hypothetical protein [Planctomycetota bacterium]
MPDDAHPMGDPPVEMVPEYWPSACSDTPRPARTIHGLFALPGFLLLWIVPKRIGASLAASGWRAAIVAHVLAMALGGGLILWAEMYNWSSLSASFWAPSWAPNVNRPIVSIGQLPWTDCVRGPFAAWALWAHESGIGAVGFARVLLIVLGVEACAVLVAVGIMPWAAAGEDVLRLFGRCLRLTWWSTTLMIPLGIAWLMHPVIRPILGLPPEWHPFDYIALSGIGLLWLSILLRSTRRYAGPAEGPAWTPRTPRCESCGYRISHPPHAGNCPECGRPVVDSLPEHRSPPAFGEANEFINGVRAYGATLHQVVFEPRFFSHLAIHTAHRRARTFFLLTCLINSLLVFVATFGFEGRIPPKQAILLQVVADAVTAASVCFGIQMLLGGLLAALISAVSRRPMQSAGVMVFYAQSTLLMWGVGVAALPWAGYRSSAWLDRYPTNIAAASGAVIVMAIALTPFVLGTYGTLRALRRAVRDTRYANA